MNSTDFFLKYNGKHLDFDGAFGAQCVDAIKAYFVEVLGIPAAKGNAIDYWNNPPTGFERIAKSTLSYPRPGDIVIWSTKPYGHIGIVNWVRTFDFNCFEQNFPIGAPCQYKTHNYSNVLGWLRFIPSPQKWTIPLTVIGSSIPGLQEQVQKWSKGTMSLDIKSTPMDLPYSPQKDFSKYAKDRFCIVSCNPGPEIYKTSMLDGLNTAYAVAGADPLTCSYELSHILTKYYNAHRGTNPFIENEDTVGGVTDAQRYRKYDVVKPFMDSVILKP